MKNKSQIFLEVLKDAAYVPFLTRLTAGSECLAITAEPDQSLASVLIDVLEATGINRHQDQRHSESFRYYASCFSLLGGTTISGLTLRDGLRE